MSARSPRFTGYGPRGRAVRPVSGLWSYEAGLQRHGFARVAGADEAGRGASAGPLVAAAVVLRNPIKGLNDSKALTHQTRERLYKAVTRYAAGYAIVVIPPEEIDRNGLHVCNVAAMRRAVALLPERPDYVLTDGFPVKGFATPSLAIWKGDQVSASIAAASILAKVTRDRMLIELDREFPGYGFAVHKGYNTPDHLAALDRLGPCEHHRRSFVTISSRLRDDESVTSELEPRFAMGGAP